MRYIGCLLFLLLQQHVALAKVLKLEVGTDPELPSCGSHCMIDSMFVTQCLDMNCLCHQEEYQKSLFQCLYSQCDANDYGRALSRTIATCMDAGAEIHMVAPGLVDAELLRAREADYLAGRPPLPAPLELRQESVPVPLPAPVPVTTVTTTHTDSFTMTVTWTSPSATPVAPFLTGSGGGSSPESMTTSISRPWVITRSNSTRLETSFSGLVLWFAIVLMQDYVFNGF